MPALDYLKEYQRAWLTDPSPRVIVLKGRQVGFSDVAVGLGSLLEALDYPHDIYLLSYSLRQAKELLRDSEKWCKVLTTAGIKFGFEAQATKLELANGSRVLAIAATPEAVRGARGSVYWDEVAFARSAREVWTALAPILGSNPRYRAVLGSTPLAQHGLFYELTQSPAWSLHRVSLLDAVRDGLPRDVERLLAESANPGREYLLQFDAGGKYFSLDDLVRAYSDDAPQAPPGAPPPARVLGVDLAKINDLSAFVELVCTDTPHVAQTWTLRSVDYRTQRELLVELVRTRPPEARITKLVIDSTKHPAFVDEVTADLRAVRDCRVVGVHGTHKLKARAWPALRRAFEQSRLTLDYDTAWTWESKWVASKRRPLLEALLKIEQVLTRTGLVTYDSRASVEEGHADAASALALAHDALGTGQDALATAPALAHGRATQRLRRSSEIVF